MVKKETLQKYAKLAVCTGTNVQKGQLLVINCSVKNYEFAQMCAEEAYKAGASKVMLNYTDEQLELLAYQYCSEEVLSEVPQWLFDKSKYVQDKGCCYLHIVSDTPGLFENVNPELMQNVQMARAKILAPLQKYTMNNDGQWSIVALPSVGWAKKVFPDLSEEEAMEKLMDAILMSSRVTDDNDPVVEWEAHNAKITAHSKMLNDYNFETLHFTNSLGTDLFIKLVKEHVWAGGCEYSTKGVLFNPNIPTEENFTMPHKEGVNGRIVATKPLSYQGKVIDEFYLDFVDGKVVHFDAKKEKESLQNLLDFDDGSCRLGEIALISYDSPINETDILFFNTLFDENASCHVALGRAYPMNVKGGTSMSQDELTEAGANYSMTHVDFMFGSRDMKIVGIQHDGNEVVVFENGNFVF